jgi:hypothetical protein
MFREIQKINKNDCCPICSYNWDGGSIAEILIKQKIDGNLYLSDKSDDIIRAIVKDDFGSENARFSKLKISDNGEAECPGCLHKFVNVIFTDETIPLPF